MRRTLPTALSAHDALKRTNNPAGWHYHLSLLIYFVRKTIYLNFFLTYFELHLRFCCILCKFSLTSSLRRSFCASISFFFFPSSENIQIHTHTRTRNNINNKTNNGPLKSQNYLKYMSIALVLLLFRSLVPATAADTTAAADSVTASSSRNGKKWTGNCRRKDDRC